MKTTRYDLVEIMGKKKIALLLAALFFPISATHAGNKLWTSPVGGFYETPSNWTPNTAPGADDIAIFGMPDPLNVGLLGDRTVGGLQFGNQSNTNIRVAGGNPTDKTLTVLGDMLIDNATVDLSRSNGSNADLHLDHQGRLLANGTLDIKNGATVESVSGEIGVAANDYGQINVAGTSADGSVSRWHVPEISVGLAGEGMLAIDGGGFVSSGESRLGFLRNGVGQAFVRGVDELGNRARWTTGVLYVGSRGNGTLNIEDGGIVTSLNGRIGASGNGQVSVSGRGADGSHSTWDVARFLTIGPVGNAAVSIEDGGMITAPTTSFMAGEFVVSGTDEDGNPSLFSATSSLAVGTNESARLRVERGGRLFSESVAIGITDDGVGEVRIRNSHSDLLSTWSNPGDAFVGGNRFGSSGTGSIEIGRNGLVEIGGKLTVWSTGTVTLDRGRLAANSIDSTSGGNLNLLRGELAVQSFQGDLENHGALVQVDNVSGNFLNSSGILSPGPDVGSTTIGGSFTQQTEATITMDIGGREPGTTHDLIGVSGPAVVGGRLELNLANDFTPDPSDEFTLFGADSIVGVFDNVATGHRVAASDGDGSFVVHYGIGSVMEENRLIAYNFLASDALLGDFDQNGTLDATDIDLLSGAVGGSDLGFDLVYDAVIDQHDRQFWVEDIMDTNFGDTNLDGQFNSTDLVLALQKGEYEDSIDGNSGWADGDWNGDGDFDTSDFILAFQSGTYEAGANAIAAKAQSVAKVPEPTSLGLLIIGWMGLLRIRARKNC